MVKDCLPFRPTSGPGRKPTSVGGSCSGGGGNCVANAGGIGAHCSAVTYIGLPEPPNNAFPANAPGYQAVCVAAELPPH